MAGNGPQKEHGVQGKEMYIESRRVGKPFLTITFFKTEKARSPLLTGLGSVTALTDGALMQ